MPFPILPKNNLNHSHNLLQLFLQGVSKKAPPPQKKIPLKSVDLYFMKRFGLFQRRP